MRELAEEMDISLTCSIYNFLSKYDMQMSFDWYIIMLFTTNDNLILNI